mmetsp:Transcript_6084/g.10934  ORF Transcript_6084/g.10934 Transcript_6084/m.10934 type:complete len:243 (+) Transcript_6084:494-1222(+)
MAVVIAKAIARAAVTTAPGLTRAPRAPRALGRAAAPRAGVVVMAKAKVVVAAQGARHLGMSMTIGGMGMMKTIMGMVAKGRAKEVLTGMTGKAVRKRTDGATDVVVAVVVASGGHGMVKREVNLARTMTAGAEEVAVMTRVGVAVAAGVPGMLGGLIVQVAAPGKNAAADPTHQRPPLVAPGTALSVQPVKTSARTVVVHPVAMVMPAARKWTCQTGATVAGVARPRSESILGMTWSARMSR